MAVTARELAASVIGRCLEKDGFSNLSLHHALNHSPLSPQDKAFCTELVYGTLRFLAPLQKSLLRAATKPDTRFPPRILPHLLVAAYQLQHLEGRVPAYAAVNSAISSIKHIAPGLAGLANAILRNLGSAPHLLLQADSTDINAIADSFGVPKMLARAVAASDPTHPFEAISALNDRPKTYLRLYHSQAPEGASPHAFVPDCVFISNAGAIQHLPGFPQGHFTVQDPASIMAALLLNAQKGQQILDMCAAPGSKSALLASKVGHEGKVIAVDINAQKAERIKDNAQRLHQSLEIRVQDAKTLAQDPTLSGRMDAVLLDAPCSALGTTRRHPEVKWRVKAEHLPAICALQEELLEAAAKLLKKGGILVYAVCSPLPEEGCEQISRFLHKHPEFTRDLPPADFPYLPHNALTSEGDLLLVPHLHDADAFFAARLKLL